MSLPPGYDDMLRFPLIEALLGRRSRRFFRGAELPDGVFAFRSRHPPMPLSELETMLVVAACGSNTGWHHLIRRAKSYAPHLSSYAGAAGGRTFPSAAGFHTSKTFFTDDTGTYVLEARDSGAFAERDEHGALDLDAIRRAVGARIRRLSDRRLFLPAEPPFVEAHNTWVANAPGSLLVVPVGDLSQHVLLGLAYLAQNRQVVFDDVHGRAIPGIERFSRIVDPDASWPISFFEQWCFAELSVELGTSCYAGALMLQAMGLGGWMYDGLDPFGVLGASGRPDVPGLGFRFDRDPRWPTPNPTGLPGVMEGSCPPHHRTMRDAVEAMCERKFGPGGPFHPDTPGPWKDSRRVRSAAMPYDETFRECVALQAQYLFDTFGRFPGTVPSMISVMVLQAHHLDLDYYDHFYEKGAYLETHARHDERWHPR
ncbi:hypothetical protein [Sandaracinus amylolyticus]|uniref:hypothetical protein n=1 Tax=Sandaracinus amylolyticus TaxID=927083 RepID=UPI001F19D0F4|nr:hypothetical protein [Sandaracinus amylolyticus]UJR83311.1 Hypothetical protein I5071_53790 [Sandaracinus amylolyticus]